MDTAGKPFIISSRRSSHSFNRDGSALIMIEAIPVVPESVQQIAFEPDGLVSKLVGALEIAAKGNRTKLVEWIERSDYEPDVPLGVEKITFLRLLVSCMALENYKKATGE